MLDFSDGSRQCTGCGERKPIDSFGKDKNASGGRRSHCKVCRSARMKSWYADNRVRQRDRQRARYADHPDVIRRQDMERYYRDKAPRLELAKAGSYKRRMRIAQFDSDVTVEGLRSRDGDMCCYCGIEMSFEAIVGRVYDPVRATVEHRVPLSKGGSHSFGNTALACWRCNIRKNARTPEEWADVEAARGGDAANLHTSPEEAGT